MLVAFLSFELNLIVIFLLTLVPILLALFLHPVKEVGQFLAYAHDSRIRVVDDCLP